MTEHFTHDEAVALARKTTMGDQLWMNDTAEITAVRDLCNAAVSAKIVEWGKQEPAAWQGRYLDVSDEPADWSDWRHVETCDLVFWQDRVAREPHYYALRPLYTHPLPAQTTEQHDHLQDIAAAIGVGGYNGATTDQLAERILSEFQRLSATT